MGVEIIMKEIKFRQPIYENGKIVRWHYWGFKDGLYQLPINQHESYQFTGLKDNKRTKEYPEGQEIYEGDIVKFEKWSISKTETRYCKVIFSDGSFRLNGKSGYIGDIEISTWFIEDYKLKVKLEVIGNEFMNPELLEEV